MKMKMKMIVRIMAVVIVVVLCITAEKVPLMMLMRIIFGLFTLFIL